MSCIESINFYIGGYLKSKDKTLADIAKELGITPTALWMKLDGRTEFKLSEVMKLASIIGVTPDTLVSFTADCD